MLGKGLDIFLRFSGLVFKTKEKLHEARGVRVVYLAIVIIGLEMTMAVFAIPLYILVPPEKIKGRKIYRKKGLDSEKHLQSYSFRRSVSLTTVLSAAGLVFLKFLLLILTSFYLLGAQTLLAATESWTFDTPGNYTYDSGKIEVTTGVARLKDTSGGGGSYSTTNSGFDSDSSGWTFVQDWAQPGGRTNSGNYQSTGGNPGGNIDIVLDPKKNNSSAAYWYQSFTTTADSPSPATLDLDWLISSVDSSFLTSLNLYAFVDTGSGNPTIGEAVWDSGNLTSVSDWASISQVDISSKIPTTGTYYLKIGVYAVYNSTNSPTGVTAEFDNVVVNWTETVAPTYATDDPTIEPTTSLNPAAVSSWDSFTETATKNGGDIFYQLSDDDGVSWQYWTGAAWATAGSTDYNTATVVNTNIGSFPFQVTRLRGKRFSQVMDLSR